MIPEIGLFVSSVPGVVCRLAGLFCLVDCGAVEDFHRNELAKRLELHEFSPGNSPLGYCHPGSFISPLPLPPISPFICAIQLAGALRPFAAFECFRGIPHLFEDAQIRKSNQKGQTNEFEAGTPLNLMMRVRTARVHAIFPFSIFPLAKMLFSRNFT